MPYPDSGLLVVSAEAANEFVEPANQEVYHEIDRLQTDLAAEELAMVKNYMLGDMCRSYESAFSLADAWIFMQLLPACRIPYCADARRSRKDDYSSEIRELAWRYLCKETLKEISCSQKLS